MYININNEIYKRVNFFNTRDKGNSGVCGGERMRRRNKISIQLFKTASCHLLILFL